MFLYFLGNQTGGKNENLPFAVVFLVGSFLILVIDSVFVFLSLSRGENKQS